MEFLLLCWRLNLLLIPRFEAIGAAIATVIGYFVIWISRVVNSRKILKIQINWKRDALAYMLIAAQIIVANNEFRFELIISGIVFLLEIIVMRKELRGLISLLRKRRI